MSALFRRHGAPTCFFCNSLVIPSPQNPSNFCCPICRCWNRYDSNGEIRSDEPAMHDEALNRKAFAKRASPSKDRLPTVYGRSQFCHACQTNQMLLVNLLANYLPSPESPEYTLRVAQLPEYRASLHVRYPPVCDACLPAVDDEIRQKDSMARTKALIGWLKDSKGKEQRRRVSAPKEREKFTQELFLWRVRGILWVLHLVLSVIYNASNAWASHSHVILRFPSILPFVSLLSIIWTFWDPTYSAYRKAQIQGRDVRVQGKGTYIKIQIVVWISRFITATLLAIGSRAPHLDYLHAQQHQPSLMTRIYFTVCFAFELFAFSTTFFILRLQQPPAIRLVDTKTHIRSSRSRSSTPSVTQHLQGYSTKATSPPLVPGDIDHLAALSLSSKPVITPSKPVFGTPSLSVANFEPANASVMSDLNRNGEGLVQDDNAMDWTPTEPPAKRSMLHDDGTWVRPQRFFAPEKPTGLEGLFERTRLADENESTAREVRRQQRAWTWPHWRCICLLSVLPIVLASATWRYYCNQRRLGTIHISIDEQRPPPVLTMEESSIYESVSVSSLWQD